MTGRDYFRSLQDAISGHLLVSASTVSFREIDVHECYITGLLTLTSGHELYVAEYVVTHPSLQRLKYRYHLQGADGSQLARWDNAPHYPRLATFPHHRHDSQDVAHPSDAMDLERVLDEIARLI